MYDNFTDDVGIVMVIWECPPPCPPTGPPRPPWYSVSHPRPICAISKFIDVKLQDNGNKVQKDAKKTGIKVM